MEFPDRIRFLECDMRQNLNSVLGMADREGMKDETIITSSKIGQRLERLNDMNIVSQIFFKDSKIQLVAKITIGRSSDNNIVVDNKLTSRHHAVIQKIKDAYFIKDEKSTNGTFLNGQRIPPEKYVKLNPGDKITIGNDNLVIS